jgi:predicted deacylase
MPPITQLGTAVARPGEISFGYVEMLELPTGITERMPVILACGRADGPTFWVTANIHGNEYTGLLAVQRAITERLAGELDQLRGTVVAVPSLNPAGLRVSRRQPYFDDHTDPNRTFPSRQHDDDEADAEPPSPYEQFSARLFEELRASADYHVDLHCAHALSMPFTLRDRVPYQDEAGRAEAERLAQQIDGLARAFGLPVISEFASKRYFREKLHRSTGGAAVYEAHIPSITPELGASNYVDPAGLRAAIAGVRNVLLWAGMLDGEPEAITWIPQPQLGYPVRRENHPRAAASGILHLLHAPGDVVRAGDPVAELRDIWGRPVVTDGDDGLIRTEREGFILGQHAHAPVYRHTPVATLAVRDDEPLTVKWPDEDKGRAS